MKSNNLIVEQKILGKSWTGWGVKNHLKDCYPEYMNFLKGLLVELAIKKKSYIPIYTEPTTVKNVDELILIKKVNKVKPIKI